MTTAKGDVAVIYKLITPKARGYDFVTASTCKRERASIRDVPAEERLPRHPQTFTPLRLYRLHKLKQCETAPPGGGKGMWSVRLRAALLLPLDIIFAGIPEAE
ncbi:hypothetical protein EVAR_99322_1 [Eumeta japonica]|uniref:Uncharacterized protein n=1 Tax=Eumeta variegata TaxID=151549 RepID=A0A4C1ZSJ0_EUMVA|nr:hypothetical protein EVAR_99322_1 [Eumeta japonica]